MPQQVFDLASLLIFLASGGLAYKLPGWLESWDWFNALGSPGKVISVVVLTLVPTFGALGAQSWLVQHPMVSDAIDPYVRAGIIAINIAITQMRHGAQNGIWNREVARFEANAAKIQGAAIRGDE